MKYILAVKTIIDDGDSSKNLKFITRKNEADNKLFYIAKDQTGKTGLVTKEWILMNIDNILNCGLSGSSIYPLVKPKDTTKNTNQPTPKKENIDVKAKAEETFETIRPNISKYILNKIGNSILITNYDEPERMFSNDREHLKIRTIIENIDRAVPGFKIWEKIYDQLIDQTIKAMVVKGYTVYKAGCHVDMSHQAYTDDECIGSCYTTSEELARKYVMSQIRKHSNDYDLEVSRDQLIDNIFCIPVREYIG